MEQLKESGKGIGDIKIDALKLLHIANVRRTSRG